jgi:hypothetical protein
MAEDLEKDIAEAEELLTKVTRPRVQKALKNVITDFKLQLETLPVAASTTGVNITKTYVEINTCAFDQEDGNVLLFWELANVGSVPKTSINATFNEDSVVATVEGLDQKNYRFTIGPLFKAIVPSKCSYKVLFSVRICLPFFLRSARTRLFFI